MRFFHHLHYIRKRVTNHLLMSLFSILLATVALTLFFLSVAIPMTITNSERSICHALAKPMEAYGIINNPETAYEQPKITSYLDALCALDEVESVGCYSFGGNTYCKTISDSHDYWQDIITIQNSHPTEFNDEDGSGLVQMAYMSRTAWGLLNTSLQSGNAPQAYDSEHNQHFLLYLGSNFDTIPIGTCFQDDYNEIFEVAGILKENSSMIESTSLFWNLQSFLLSAGVDMDNMVLVLLPAERSYFYLDNLFLCADGYSYEEASEAIRRLSDEYGIPAETCTLKARVDEMLSVNRSFERPVQNLFVIVSISVVLIVLTMQLLKIFVRGNEFGIWLANGMGRRDTFIILIGENMLQLILAFCFSILITVLFVLAQDWDTSVIQELQDTIFVPAALATFLTAVVLALLSAALPSILIRRKPETELLKGNWS